MIRLVRIPAQAPATAFLEFGVRDWRIVFAGVDDGDGMACSSAPEVTMGGDVCDATVSTGVSSVASLMEVAGDDG